jgi:hypothetical protein
MFLSENGIFWTKIQFKDKRENIDRENVVEYAQTFGINN